MSAQTNDEIKRFPTINCMLDEGAFMPVRGHELDAGLDLRTKRTEYILAHSSVEIDTGVHLEIPAGWFGKLESKSGLNVKRKIFCGGGVIDAGFTGSIICRLYNASDDDYMFNPGDKCVQIVFMPISTPELVMVDKFGEYERGTSGYGSTGK